MGKRKDGVYLEFVWDSNSDVKTTVNSVCYSIWGLYYLTVFGLLVFEHFICECLMIPYLLLLALHTVHIVHMFFIKKP